MADNLEWHWGLFDQARGGSSFFFMVRAMQDLVVSVLVFGSMSILGRVYKPGLR